VTLLDTTLLLTTAKGLAKPPPTTTRFPRIYKKYTECFNALTNDGVFYKILK
jgi:hypothetical protein